MMTTGSDILVFVLRGDPSRAFPGITDKARHFIAFHEVTISFLFPESETADRGHLTAASRHVRPSQRHDYIFRVLLLSQALSITLQATTLKPAILGKYLQRDIRKKDVGR